MFFVHFWHLIRLKIEKIRGNWIVSLGIQVYAWKFKPIPQICTNLHRFSCTSSSARMFSSLRVGRRQQLALQCRMQQREHGWQHLPVHMSEKSERVDTIEECHLSKGWELECRATRLPRFVDTFDYKRFYFFSFSYFFHFNSLNPATGTLEMIHSIFLTSFLLSFWGQR